MGSGEDEYLSACLHELATTVKIHMKLSPNSRWPAGARLLSSRTM